MKVVTNASPLIFLAKLDRLDLLTVLYAAPLHVPVAVWNEVLPPHLEGAERRALEELRPRLRLHPVRIRRAAAPALSPADLAVVTLARRLRADLVLAGDRDLRKLALSGGLRVRGTIGILAEAVARRKIAAEDAVESLDQLVQRHGLQVNPALYLTVRRWLVARIG